MSGTREKLRICCIGDVVAGDGRRILQHSLPRLRAEKGVDCFIVNAENSAGGAGITPSIADELRGWGVHCITLGDHAWQRREIKDYFKKNTDFCIRPVNYPPGAPGVGCTRITLESGIQVGICNLIGRVFMNAPVDCPFRAADRLLENELAEVAIRICDFHSEATSEKIAMGRYLDGRMTLVYGTHTHVQTADEQLLAGGTAYITDLGMTGSTAGVIGMDASTALARFLTGLPHAYKAAKGAASLCGVITDVDIATGKAIAIERVQISE